MQCKRSYFCCSVCCVFHDSSCQVRLQHNYKLRSLDVRQTFTILIQSTNLVGGLRRADRGRRLAAQTVLHITKAAHESLGRRNDAVTNFIQQVKGYRNAHQDVECDEFLLRWIKQQIPSIELESGSFKNHKDDAARVANGEPLDVAAATGVEEPHRDETRGQAVGGSGALPVK